MYPFIYTQLHSSKMLISQEPFGPSEHCPHNWELGLEDG